MIFLKSVKAAPVLLPLSLLTSCSQETKETEPEPDLPMDPLKLELPEGDLSEGRKIWMKNCAVCHIPGLQEAPIIGNHEDWKQRIAKGMDTLYAHAINGFMSKSLNEMPARGGNPSLSDEEVRKAVRFVVYASKDN